jgi:hypothetical protein
MNHVRYQAALTRRDDLLRDAANRRLAKQAKLVSAAPLRNVSEVEGLEPEPVADTVRRRAGALGI